MASTDLEKLADVEKDDPAADALGKLSDELELLKDARLEERFGWICVCIILLDTILFDKMESWSGPIIIGAIELILLVVLARRFGIQEVSQMLAKFLDRAAERSQK